MASDKNFDRQRDVFPLPFLNEPGFDSGKQLSRSVRRRFLRRLKTVQWANDGIRTLNSIASAGAPRALGPGHRFPKAASQAAERVAKCYFDRGSPPDDDAVREGALGELLASSSVYTTERQDIQPYARDLVSWPSPGTTPLNVLDGVPEGDREWLEGWEKHLLRDAADFAKESEKFESHRVYCDPALFNVPTKYVKFLKELESRGMLRWRRAADGETGNLGIFFVKKKKNGKLRIVFDTRKLNLRFIDPPSTRLPSSASFANIECNIPDDAHIFFASGDVENCFYGMSVPIGLSDLFSLTPIAASLVGVSSLDGSPIAPQDLLIPCLTVLPMGWNWSLHICQLIVSKVIGETCDRGRLRR